MRTKILKAWAIACLLLLTSSTARSETPSVENTIGTFDSSGKLHNPTERTYRFPDVGVFAAYYPKTSSLASGLSVEFMDHSWNRRWWRRSVGALQVSDERLGLALGIKLVPVIDFTVSVVFSRSFRDDVNEWGLSFGVVKF